MLPVLAQDPASDDFQRASLGANWTKYNANAEIVNGADLGSLTPSTTSLMYVGWTASTFAADQFCEAVVAAGRPDTMLIQLFVRRRASDVARYAFAFTDENGSGGIGPPQWIIKYDGVPTAQTRTLASAPATPPVPGDTLRIEATGTSPVLIKGFLNGVQIISATDNDHNRITTSGPVGMAARLRLGGFTAPANSPLFASWRGGSPGVPPATAVTVDAGTVYQRIDGFGTSSRVFDDPHVFDNFNPATQRALTVLTTTEQDAVLDKLYVDLQLTRVRPVQPETEATPQGPVGIEPQNDNADPDVIDPSRFNFAWKNLDAHLDYLTRARQRGVTTYFLSPLNREVWMGTTTANDGAEYAERLLAQAPALPDSRGGAALSLDRQRALLFA